MRIVNIILSSQNGGSEQVFIDYLMVLKKLNHQLLAITKEDAPFQDKVLELGIELKKIKNNFGYFDLFAVNKIRKILKEFKADAVIAHVGRSMILVRKAIGKNKNIKLIAVNHSANVKRSIGSDIILSVNRKVFYRTIDLGQPQNKSFVMYNAIDLKDAINNVSETNLQNKKEIVIGIMGRFDKSKGFDVVLKALKNLEKISDKKFILKIAGSGKEEAHLKALNKELNLEDKVEFCGWVKDKKSFFESIDVFCMSSIGSPGETFGLVLLEAIKYRKVIVTTACEGPSEVIRDKIDGLLIELEPLDNLDERIAEAIKTAVSDENLRNKMIENSFARMKENFSYEALEKRMKDVFGSC
jgi:glycosyltransferase involved in cell wall biosynthesis